MADNYVCTLDEASVKVAKAELNEDPKDRLSAVEALRKLLKEKNPHIKCPMDTNYLLAFLRTRKFSQLEAVSLIERHLTKRAELKAWFYDLDPKDPKLTEFFQTGAFLLLPKRDKQGRKIFMIRPRYIDVKKTKKELLFKGFATFMYYVYLCDENTQVNGTVTVFDATDMTQGHQNFISLEDRKNMFGIWQKGLAARMKAFHMYNLGAFADFMLMIAKLVMSEKMQKRVSRHSDLETLYKQIPLECLPEDYLPDEYEGPHAGTTQEIVDAMVKDMTSGQTYDRIKAYSSSQWQVDLSKKSSEVPQASFRKLNID